MKLRLRRDDRGAMAIMVGVSVMLLLSIAALGVDLGHAFVEKSSVQKLTDFAALSGGAGRNLPGTTSGTCAYGKKAVATDQAVQDTADFLGSEPWTGGPSASDLVDCSLANGEAVYGSLSYATGSPVLTYNENKLTVVSPPRRVDFGLAKVMGFDGTNVTGTATAEVGTPGSPKTVPSYAVSGCDWGLQTITSPANGHVVGFVPLLSHSADSNIATLSPSGAPNPYPDEIDLNPTAPVTITVHGTKLDEVTKIGFFEEGSGGAAPEPLTIPQGSFTSQPGDGKSISFVLPDEASAPGLTSTDRLFWVRVWAPESNSSTTFKWSAIGVNGDKTVPFEVGTPYMRCLGASNEGNYGTLRLPRTDSNDSTSDGWMPRNIALNLQTPLSLHTYPGAPTVVGGVSTAPNTCDVADTGRTVYSTTTGSPTLRPNTNCVDTDPGLPANAVSAGFVEGIGSGAGRIPGRLEASSDTTCSARRTVTLSGNRSYSINNDLLTCFLTTSVPLSTISGPGYPGPGVLSCDVFDSPRFFYQPVLQTRPSSGGSLHYSIVDFRPAFVTSQPGTATRGSLHADEHNGIVVDGGQISEVNVVFFNNNALNQDCSNSFGPSLGGTTKRVVRLVN